MSTLPTGSLSSPKPTGSASGPTSSTSQLPGGPQPVKDYTDLFKEELATENLSSELPFSILDLLHNPSKLPSTIPELTEILARLSSLTPEASATAAATVAANPGLFTSVETPAPSPHPYQFPTKLGPHLHEQTFILSALTALLQLLQNQRWTPSTAASNLLSLQCKRRTVSTMSILPPRPRGKDQLARLQYHMLLCQKDAWEKMTVDQREYAYEGLVAKIDAALVVARARERRAEAGVLERFDREFDEALAVLVERWSEWSPKGLGDDMVMPCLYGWFLDK